jgi:hypothetical protein
LNTISLSLFENRDPSWPPMFVVRGRRKCWGKCQARPSGDKAQCIEWSYKLKSVDESQNTEHCYCQPAQSAISFTHTFRNTAAVLQIPRAASSSHFQQRQSNPTCSSKHIQFPNHTSWIANSTANKRGCLLCSVPLGFKIISLLVELFCLFHGWIQLHFSTQKV